MEKTHLKPKRRHLNGLTFYTWNINGISRYLCVFQRPPMYRSPVFPVFFYTGTSHLDRNSPDESLQTSTSSPELPFDAELEIESVDAANLGHLLQGLSDELHTEITPSYRYMSTFQQTNFVSSFMSGIASAATLSFKNIFKWEQKKALADRVDQNTDFCRSRRNCVTHIFQTISANSLMLPRSNSLPDMELNSSFEEFTPDISADEDDETYRFQFSCPGLYQCSVTGLVFHMKGEGDVVYRSVPWNRRLLSQHHKKPAGPLFDIKCLQQSVSQLHLPHCEILSTGGGQFLSVAHVSDEGIEFISPHQITETHVVINITGFSGFGNVKDEDSPPDPVRALVLLFYRPPDDPDPESLINVLMLPKNVSLRDVLRTRKKLIGDETYIETTSDCKLRPQRFYSLSTRPQDDSVLVQPTEAEFHSDNYDNYIPSFQVDLETKMKHIKLFLRDTNSSDTVWERRIYLLEQKSSRQHSLSLLPNQILLDVRRSFIDGISGPVLKDLLDKLLEKKVISDSERESADVMENRGDKARFVIDTVRKKGEAASSEMMEFLCEVDPFLCENIGLI